MLVFDINTIFCFPTYFFVWIFLRLRSVASKWSSIQWNFIKVHWMEPSSGIGNSRVAFGFKKFQIHWKKIPVYFENPLDGESSGFWNSSVPFGNTNSTGKSTVSNLGFYLKLKQWIFQWISLDAGFRWMRTEDLNILKLNIESMILLHFMKHNCKPSSDC